MCFRFTVENLLRWNYLTSCQQLLVTTSSVPTSSILGINTWIDYQLLAMFVYHPHQYISF